MPQTTEANHKQPLDNYPSSFALSCLANKAIASNGQALDLACGYGRHTHILRSKGFSVVSGDLSMDSLKTIKRDSLTSDCVCLDAHTDLPFRDHSFNLVIIIHFAHKMLLSRVTRLVSPGGFLVYETYGGQGGNWRFLPIKGELEGELGSSFSVITKREKSVGPKDNQYVSSKIFAQKNYD